MQMKTHSNIVVSTQLTKIQHNYHQGHQIEHPKI